MQGGVLGDEIYRAGADAHESHQALVAPIVAKQPFVSYKEDNEICDYEAVDVCLGGRQVSFFHNHFCGHERKAPHGHGGHGADVSHNGGAGIAEEFLIRIHKGIETYLRLMKRLTLPCARQGRTKLLYSSESAKKFGKKLEIVDPGLTSSVTALP